MTGPLISVRELRAALAFTPELRVLDVRWRLDRPEGRPDYLSGHVPGAVYVDLEGELASRGDPARGRHPLPSPEELQASARRWGLHTDDPVVVYDDLQSVPAARAWWLLRGAGVRDVRVLDGGLAAWIAAGLPVETGDATPRRPGDVVLTGLPTALDADGAAHAAHTGVLLDVRARRLYRGDDDPFDPVAGHIPGARSLPTTLHVQGTHLQRARGIAATFHSVGAAPGVTIAAYCGSGVASAHSVLAGAVAGLDVALYAGGWSEWSRTRGRTYAVGDGAADDLLPI